MARSNENLALALLVDASAETAREQGQRGRDDRVAAAHREVQQAADARRREVRDAFSMAGGRIVMLAPVWLFLCCLILVNNFIGNPIAAGSYAVTTWTFIMVIAAGLAIDLTVGRGSDGWFVVGALIGFVLNAWYAFSRLSIAPQSLDVSMFWLTGLFGIIAYLLSALHASQSRR